MKKEFKVKPEIRARAESVSSPALGVRRIAGKVAGKALASKAFGGVRDRYSKSLNSYLENHAGEKIRSYVKNPYKALENLRNR